MENNPNPLTYHYESRIKLDHFLLGADVALLGWTVVNLNWLPPYPWFEIGIVAFWLVVLVSLVFGILRQMYSSEAFGMNFLKLDAAERANLIERSTIGGGTFINQQTKESINADEFRGYADIQRDNEKKFEARYEKVNDKSAWLGNWSFYLLITGLCILAAIRILAFNYK